MGRAAEAGVEDLPRPHRSLPTDDLRGMDARERLRDSPRGRPSRRRADAGERDAAAAHLLERPQSGLAGAVPVGPGRDVLDPGDVDRDDDHPLDVGVAAVLRILADLRRVSGTRPAPAEETQGMPETARDFRPGDPRSKGAIPQRRIPQAWPKDRRFRILSLDGGGIKGLFPATVLAELERRYLGGAPVISIWSPARRPAASSRSVSEPA